MRLPFLSTHAICRMAEGLVILIVSMSVAGCRLARPSDLAVGTGYDVANVHLASKQLAPDIRRVAMLPLTCATADANMDSGREILETILREELGKTHRFEVVVVSPEKMSQWTGRANWAAEDVLPENLLAMLRDKLGCDAVLFSRLTQFRAYPPLAVGLNLKLIVTTDSEQIWVVDEVFDASESSVVNSARRFQMDHETLPGALADSRSILASPLGFGRYAAQATFATLPSR